MDRCLKKGAYRRSSSYKGFTLVEILATFVLIAIIVPVAMKGISLSTRMGSQAKRQIEAGTLAETKLTDFLLSGDWINGDQSGEFTDDKADYRWSLELEDWEKEESMQQLDLNVEWTDASGKTHSVVLTTLVYSGSG